MIRGFLTGGALAVALAVAAASEKPFWQVKPPDTWSRQECAKFLSSSPWVSQWPPVGNPSNDSPGVKYRAQLWSVSLLRQAMVRYAQLDPGYARLTPEARKLQDEEGARFLAAQFPDTIVVQVQFWRNDPRWVWFWRGQSIEQLKGIVLLGEADRNVLPVGFTPPTAGKAEMQFVFPRFIKGEPLTRPGDPLLGLQLKLPAFSGYARETVLLKFDPREMRVDGQLLY